jgi:ATP-dependent DNA helicase RecG
MSMEGHLVDRKSLRTVSGKTANFVELAKDCVAFVNAQDGSLLIGIEDGESLPPGSNSLATAGIMFISHWPGKRRQAYEHHIL